MSNVAGYGRTGTGQEATMKTRLGKTSYENLLGKGGEAGVLATYSQELGYLPSESLKGKLGSEKRIDSLRMLKDKLKAGKDPKKTAVAERAAELEAISNYYTTVIDEMGDARRGLVGEKFLQIIEEPGKDPGWDEREIEKGLKGAKLNLLAFPAYATIFGEQSKLLEEMAQGGGVDTTKHWEYIKALQMLNDKSQTMLDSMTKDLENVDISSIRRFVESTGRRGTPTTARRSLTGTVLDTSEYPSAFNLKLPTVKPGEDGSYMRGVGGAIESGRESFYIPGASARGTYPEKLIAGEEGMDVIARRITHITNMGKDLEEFLANPEAYMDTKSILKKLIGGLSQETKDMVESKNINTDRLKEIFDTLYAGMEDTINSTVESLLVMGPKSREKLTEKQYIDEFSAKEGLAKGIYQMSDILIGPKYETTKGTRYEHRLKAPTRLDKLGSSKAMNEFAKQNLGIDAIQAEIDKRVDNLTRAKIDYYNSLAKAALGKTGSIQELLFTKQIPSIMAKATTAVVDRRTELDTFAQKLESLGTEYGSELELNFKALAKVAGGISKDHASKIAKTLKAGLPVLKQHELGIPANMAAKVPATFDKMFSTKQDKAGISSIYPAKKDSAGEYRTGKTLLDLMEYREDLEEALVNSDTKTQAAVNKYIEENLTPYIEAIRYPFTGISSIQPFKAKILDKRGERGLESRSLSIPGVPEMDVAGFDKLLTQLKKEATRLTGTRETQRLKGEPTEKTTAALEALEKAISAAIPKYIAHQMKLDFDGDEIEVHSATFAKARKEIEKHYKALTNVDKALSTTGGRYRDKFTYENLPTTGENVIAEMAMAFEKKFESGKGFEFLKTPFLTRDLEYLPEKDKLSVLTKARPDIETPLIGIESVLEGLGKTSAEIAGIKEALSEIKPGDDVDKYSEKLLTTLNNLDKQLGKEVGAGITTKLFEEKYKDVIEAQLFKIHTGTETESMARLQRIGESAIGFGSGMLGGTYAPTEKFTKRYPGSIGSLGIDMEEEFHTMLNEMFRFAIQKGMDVKHAGAPPIAGELVNYISKGVGGAQGLWERIEKEDSYGELKDLYESSQEAIMFNLGKKPTDLIREVARDISNARGLGEDVGQMPRNELTQLIVDQLGFKGFLEQLSMMIKDAAIEGLIAQAKNWKPGTSAIKGISPIKGEIGEWAEEQVQKQMTGRGGINIRKLFTEGKQPLYKFRTSAANVSTQLDDYRAKYDDPMVPKGISSGLKNRKVSLDYIEKYKNAKATASNIAEEFMRAGQTIADQSGGYADMVSSGLKALEDTQKEIQKIAMELESQGYGPRSGDLFDRLRSLHPMESTVIDQDSKERKKDLDYGISLTGAPRLSDLELYNIKDKYSTEVSNTIRDNLTKDGLSGDELERVVETEVADTIAKLKALAQLDKIFDVIESKKGDSAVMKAMFGAEGNVEELIKSRRESRDSIADQAARSFVGKKLATGEDTAREGKKPPSDDEPGMGLGPPSGKVIPVHLKSIEPNILSKFRDANITMTTGTPMRSAATDAADAQAERFKEFSKIMSTMTSVGEGDTGSGSYESLYSPSRLKGGGDFHTPFKNEADRQRKQIEEIKKTMLDEQDPMTDYNQVLADIGTAMHEKLQRTKFDDKNKYKIEKLLRLEAMDNEPAGEITGFADVVEYEKDSLQKEYVKRIIDIKTTSKDVVDRLNALIGDAEKGDLKEILNKTHGEVRRKLEDAFSQVNTYLASLGDELRDDTKGEIQFYERTAGEIKDPAIVSFSYDNERFKKDMKAVHTARALAMDAIAVRSAQFGSLPSYEDRQKQESTDIDMADINKAIEIGFEKAEKLAGQSTYTRKKQATTGEAAKRAQKEVEARAAAAAGSGQNYDDYLYAPPIAEGKGIESVFQNIKTLHEQAELYQKRYNDVSREALKIEDTEASNEITTALDKIKELGPSQVQNFIDKLNALQESGQISGKDSWKAWRLYRIEAGNFLLKQAEDAKKKSDEAKAAGDEAGAADKYGEFESATRRLQENIRRGVGKRTDIYTENRKFLYPELAQKAGVYLNPKQITRRATDPLGDDAELIKIFKSLTGDLRQGADVIAPVEKVRETLAALTKVDREMVSLLTSSEKFARMGDDVQEAWQFTGLADNITKLRAALEGLTRFNLDDFGAVQQKNIFGMIKYLKTLETAYANASKADFGSTGQFGETGIVKVPTFETPTNQLAMHRRNIQKSREYARRPEEGGGLEIGKSFSYTAKVVGESGEVLQNTIHTFKKYGEEVTSTGEKIGKFSERQKDLIEIMSRSGATFGNAIRRVVMWGAASRLIYGGISNLKQSLDELANVEMGIAQLRMVMSPLETDFQALSKSAVGFAKQYGIPVTEVLKSMRIFAQQGLSQAEVIERTQTSTIAANVTTLDAKSATEALTAAMKSFREEGDSSLRFLDSWSEVEAKHAITAADMANAIKKSAAAAKNAGFTFDELNGIVASIGAVTRQSGKEVGTAMRFIVRRIFSEKGPKELGKLNISTLTPEGENRRGFDILNDLSMSWKDLTSAQKLNIAQALGGTRQYNALLVAMDNWDEALRGIRNSTNSKGSAERRNLEIMKTYAKQLEQTRAAATELKLEFGKVVLPTFKIGLKAMKLLLEGISSIPAPIKVAAAALGGLFVAGAKGIDVFETLSDTFAQGSAVLSSFGNQFGKQLDIAKFEVLGKETRGLDTFGLKTIRDTGGPAEQGKSFKDFNSILGMTAYGLREVGVAYNAFLGNLGGAGGGGIEKAGASVKKFGQKLDDLLDVPQLLAGANISTLVDDIVIGLGQGAAKTTKYTGAAFEYIGSKFGKGAELWVKNFASANTGLTKALAPLAITAVAAYKAVDTMGESFAKATKSASDFEKYMDGARRSNESALKGIRNLSMEYDRLDDQLEQAQKASQPGVKDRRQDLGTYEAPLVTQQKIQKDVIALSNNLGQQNLNLVVGYDKLGNAILKTTGNFKGYLNELDKLQVKSGVGKELNILDKFTEDLTKTGGSEKIKKAFKDLLGSTPIFGDLVGRQIKVSPAKVLEDAAGRLNKIINIKNRHPLSTAADEDIEELQKVLGKARDVYQDTYSDFDRVYKNILSRATLKGLDPDEITDILSSTELKEAYKLRLDVDPKFRLAKGVTWQDIMGKELMSVLFPKSAGLIDVSAELTKATLETAGIKSRSGKVLSGDLVTFTEEAAESYSMAGRQAIIKFKETTDGIYEWVAQYFNTKTLQIEEKAFGSEMEKMVDQIFPLQAIQEELTYRMDALNTFVSGAAAGLVGLTKKDFKKDFDLGSRFFSGVPTSTILQGDKGYTPKSGYGQISLQKDWQKDITRFYLAPMEELKLKTEQLSKLTNEGLRDVDLAKGTYDEINKLLTVLKNNQVVLQFKSVFVDLMKEFSDSSRVLRENIAIQKMRNKLDLETAGLMSGTAKGLSDIDTGLRTVEELTPKQRLVRTSPEYTRRAERVQGLQEVIASNLDMSEKVARALVSLDDVSSIAEGFGATISPGELKNFVEKTAVPVEAQEKLLMSNKNVEEHTADTVNRLDAMLENMGDPVAIEKQLNSVSNALRTTSSPGKIVSALDKVTRVRARAEKRGDQDVVIATNKTIDKLIKNLVGQLGFTKAREKVGTPKITSLFRKRLTEEEFTGRALTGVNSELLLSKLNKYASEEKKSIIPFRSRPALEQSKELARLRKLQERDNRKSFINSRQIAKATAAAAAIAAFEKGQNTRVVKNLDTQIGKLDEQIKQGKESGKTEKELRGLGKQRAALSTVRNERQQNAEFYGMVTALSGITAGVTELATALGLTEGQIKLLGVGAAGTYAAIKLVSKVTGKEMPESAKTFGNSLNQAARSSIEKGKIDKFAFGKTGLLGKELVKDINQKTREAFGSNADEISKGAAKLDIDKLTAAFEKQGAGGDYEGLIREAFGGDIDKLAQKASRGVDVAESSKRIQQAIVTYAAVTMADYISKQNEYKVKASGLEKTAKEQSEAWLAIAEKYPEAFESAIADLNKSTQRVAEGTADVTKIDTPIVQDTKKQKEIVRKAIIEQQRIISETMQKTFREAKREQLKMLYDEARESDAKDRQDFARTARSNQAGAGIDARYGNQAMVTPALKGFMGDLVTPLLKEQMSVQQRVYTEASDKFKKTIDTYTSALNNMDLVAEKLKGIKAKIAQEEEVISFSDDGDVRKAATNRIKELNKEYGAQEKLLGKVTKRVQEFIQTKSALDAFSSSIYKLTDALKNVGVNETVNNLLKQNDSNLANLYGGGGLNAPLTFSPEEKREAARVGVELVDFVSTKYDKQIADIKGQLYPASGQGPQGYEATKLQKRLNDLQTGKFQRYEQKGVDQLVQNEKLRNQLEPYRQALKDLEEVSRLPGLDESVRAQIEEQMLTIKDALDKATAPLSKAEALAEAEGSRSFKSHIPFTDARKEYLDLINRINDAGDSQYRGIEGLDPFEAQISEIKKALSTAPSTSMLEAAVAITDPIVAAIDRTNTILKAISEFEFKLDFDRTLFDDLFNEKKAVEKASGGHVFGAGGPREDKVPAYLSPGEFVIKASSASKLGSPLLNHLNSKGNIPGFEDGGEVLDDELLEKERKKIEKERRKKLGFFGRLKETGETHREFNRSMRQEAGNQAGDLALTKNRKKYNALERSGLFFTRFVDSAVAGGFEGTAGLLENIGSLGVAVPQIYKASKSYINKRGVSGAAVDIIKGGYKGAKIAGSEIASYASSGSHRETRDEQISNAFKKFVDEQVKTGNIGVSGAIGLAETLTGVGFAKIPLVNAFGRATGALGKGVVKGAYTVGKAGIKEGVPLAIRAGVAGTKLAGSGLGLANRSTTEFFKYLSKYGPGAISAGASLTAKGIAKGAKGIGRGLDILGKYGPAGLRGAEKGVKTAGRVGGRAAEAAGDISASGIGAGATGIKATIKGFKASLEKAKVLNKRKRDITRGFKQHDTVDFDEFPGLMTTVSDDYLLGRALAAKGKELSPASIASLLKTKLGSEGLDPIGKFTALKNLIKSGNFQDTAKDAAGAAYGKTKSTVKAGYGAAKTGWTDSRLINKTNAYLNDFANRAQLGKLTESAGELSKDLINKLSATTGVTKEHASKIVDSFKAQIDEVVDYASSYKEVLLQAKGGTTTLSPFKDAQMMDDYTNLHGLTRFVNKAIDEMPELGYVLDRMETPKDIWLSTRKGTKKASKLRKSTKGHEQIFDDLTKDFPDLDSDVFRNVLNIRGKDVSLKGTMAVDRKASYIEHMEQIFDQLKKYHEMPKSGRPSNESRIFKNKNLDEVVEGLKGQVDKNLGKFGLHTDYFDINELATTALDPDPKAMSKLLNKRALELSIKPPAALKKFSKNNNLDTDDILSKFVDKVTKDPSSVFGDQLLNFSNLQAYRAGDELPRNLLTEITDVFLTDDKGKPFYALQMVKQKDELVNRIANIGKKAGSSRMVRRDQIDDIKKLTDYLLSPKPESSGEDLLMDFVGGAIEPRAANLAHRTFMKRVGSSEKMFEDKFKNIRELGGTPDAMKDVDEIKALHKALSGGLNFDFEDIYKLKSEDIYKDIIGRNSFIKRIVKEFAEISNNANTVSKASGGRIFGEGGPREDKVPAYLSPGEFVVRAAAAQKIGYTNLETMNKKGAVPAFEGGGSLTDLQEKYPKPKKPMNPTVAGLLAAFGAIGKGAVDIDAWKETLGIGALERIYQGKGGILDYIEGGMMALPAASMAGKLTSGGTKLATTTGKNLVKFMKGLGKTKKAKTAALDIAKELGLDMSMADAKILPKRGMPEGIEEYLTGSLPPAKISGVSPDRLMNVDMASNNLSRIGDLLKVVDDTTDGKRALENALEAYKGKKFTRDSLIEVLEKAKADKDLLKEITGYEEFLGYGAEGIVLGGTTEKTAGKVVRLSDIHFSDEYLKGIQTSRYVNPIQSSKKFEKSGIQAIKSEKVEPATSVINRMHEKARSGALSPEDRFFQESAQDSYHKMRHNLIKEGKIKTIDPHEGNIGYTARGQAKIIDYGSVAPTVEMGQLHSDKIRIAASEIKKKTEAVAAAKRKPGQLQGMDFSDLDGPEELTGGFALVLDSKSLPDKFALSEFAEGGAVEWAKEKIEQAKEFFRDKLKYTVEPDKIEGAGVRKHYKELEEQMEELEKVKKNKFADGTKTAFTDRIKERQKDEAKRKAIWLEEFAERREAQSLERQLRNAISNKPGRYAGGDEPLLNVLWGKDKKPANPSEYGKGGFHKDYTIAEAKAALAAMNKPGGSTAEDKSSMKGNGYKFLSHKEITKHDKMVRDPAAVAAYERNADINPEASRWSDPDWLVDQAKQKEKWAAYSGNFYPDTGRSASTTYDDIGNMPDYMAIASKQIKEVRERRTRNRAAEAPHYTDRPNTKAKRTKEEEWEAGILESLKNRSAKALSKYSGKEPTKDSPAETDAKAKRAKEWEAGILKDLNDRPARQQRTVDAASGMGFSSKRDENGSLYITDSLTRIAEDTPDPTTYEFKGKDLLKAQPETVKKSGLSRDDIKAIIDKYAKEELGLEGGGMVPSDRMKQKEEESFDSKWAPYSVNYVKDHAFKVYEAAGDDGRIVGPQFKTQMYDDAMAKVSEQQQMFADNEVSLVESKSALAREEGRKYGPLVSVDKDRNKRRVVYQPTRMIGSKYSVKNAKHDYEVAPDAILKYHRRPSDRAAAEQEKLDKARMADRDTLGTDPLNTGVAMRAGTYTASMQNRGLGQDEVRGNQALGWLNSYSDSLTTRKTKLSSKEKKRLGEVSKVKAKISAYMLQDDLASKKDQTAYRLLVKGVFNTGYIEEHLDKKYDIKQKTKEEAQLATARATAAEKTFGQLRKRKKQDDKPDIEILDYIKKIFSDEKTASSGVSETKSALESVMSKIAEIAAFNKADGGSVPVYHHGGEVRKTGNIFAQKGEVVLPKSFADGGMVDDKVMSQSLNKSVVATIDTSELKKLMAQPLTVEETTVKVDKVEVEQPEWGIEVKQPEWEIEIEQPDPITVALDTGDAESRLASSISDAINNATVNVEATGTAGVGGQELDALGEAIAQVSDRVFELKTTHDDKINIIESKLSEENIDIGQAIEQAVDRRVASVDKSISDTNSNMDTVRSSSERQRQYFEQKLSDVEYRLNNISNITGVVG